MKIQIIKITYSKREETRRESEFLVVVLDGNMKTRNKTQSMFCVPDKIWASSQARMGRKQRGWNEEICEINFCLSFASMLFLISHLGTGSVENGQEKNRENEKWQFDSNKMSFYCSSSTLRIWFLFICDAVVWLGGSSYTHESSLHEQHVSPSPTLHSWPLPSLVLLVVVVRWCRFDFDFVLPPPLPAESIASSVIVSSHE